MEEGSGYMTLRVLPLSVLCHPCVLNSPLDSSGPDSSSMTALPLTPHPLTLIGPGWLVLGVLLAHGQLVLSGV